MKDFQTNKKTNNKKKQLKRPEIQILHKGLIV